MSGIDLVRRYHQRIALVVLDGDLPDIEGRTVCLCLREICATLVILPFTDYRNTRFLLSEFGCLPAVVKPATQETLASALHAALNSTPPPPVSSGLLDLAREQSRCIERLIRQQRARPSIIVYATSPLRRAGMAALLNSFAQVCEVGEVSTVQLFLSRTRYTAIVADAAAQGDVAQAVVGHGVPVVLIAADALQAWAIDSIGVACVLLETDPAIALHLAGVITNLSHGEMTVRPPVPPRMPRGSRHVAPPRLITQFAGSGLSHRELDILWLDHQGLSSAAIAHTLNIMPSTVISHWKRIRRKLGSTRAAIQARVAAHMDNASGNVPSADSVSTLMRRPH
ncbi:MAG TPA: LuxR C-terminal-related transcriptional regulator [Roseiflexaceae bacterium]|nr:LuxR C-terminal-related transcriptional regulator [Roseiflexaceae bacterium]